ncbi:MAG: DUF924 family protein, partial [Acetobacteraceae bacterium]
STPFTREGSQVQSLSHPPAISLGGPPAEVLGMATADDILRFWFADSLAADADLATHERRWFRAGRNLDLEIASRFGDDIDRGGRGEYDDWTRTARGRLGLIILLDQLPRNAFRGTAKAFAFDARAASLCREGLAAGADNDLALIEQLFFYLPLLHSENRADQRQSVDCFARLLARASPRQRRHYAVWVGWARRHRAVIGLFGRFPHRNAVLGRRSNGAERVFLTVMAMRFAWKL